MFVIGSKVRIVFGMCSFSVFMRMLFWAAECHLPYGITQCYCHQIQVNVSCLNPSKTGLCLNYLPPREIDDTVDLDGWWCTEIVYDMIQYDVWLALENEQASYQFNLACDLKRTKKVLNRSAMGKIEMFANHAVIAIQSVTRHGMEQISINYHTKPPHQYARVQVKHW